MIDGAQCTTLSVGERRFTAYEMGEGPLVLCLHGFPDTPFTWRHLLPALADAGYRAVAVTLRGYEPSSQRSAKARPGDYRVHDLAGDVAGWLDALGETEAHLVTHDWGATIGYAASSRFPERIRSLVAMAVPHPARLGALIQSNKAQLKASSYIMFFQLKGIAEAWVRLNNFAFFDRTWRKWSPRWSDSAEDLKHLKKALSQPGTLNAALSYYRDATNQKDLESLSLISGEIPVSTLGLYGARDGCILPDVFAEAMVAKDFPKGLTVEQIEGAGHFLHLEKPAEVGGRIARFLKEDKRPGPAA